jgi:hypothetical protein
MTFPHFEVVDCNLEKNLAVLSIRDKYTNLPRRHVCKFTFLMRVLSRYMIEQGCLAEDVRMIKQILSSDKTRHRTLSNSWTCLLKKQHETQCDYRRRLDGLCACNDKATNDINSISELVNLCKSDCTSVKETCRVNNNSICSILDRLDRIESCLDIRPGRVQHLPPASHSSQHHPRYDDDLLRHEDDRYPPRRRRW